MSRPIRTLTEGKGYNTGDHNLAVFGGAGGQHCCSVARTLNIENVAIHKYSSLLSAYGIALADMVIEKQMPVSSIFNYKNMSSINEKLNELERQVELEYIKQKTSESSSTMEFYLNMKYEGTDTCLMIVKPENNDDFKSRFIAQHKQDFGFSLDREVVVEDARVILTIHSDYKATINPFSEVETISKLEVPTSFKTSKVYFEHYGYQDSKVYVMNTLPKGSIVVGPAIIIDDTQTILIEHECSAHILSQHVLVNVSQSKKTELSSTVVDPVQLSVFGHRFMSIAEQMGKTLQMTTISTNRNLAGRCDH